ncbi:MAG: antitoxin ParD1/3/4 [Lentimonas sp.]|jgi:antitoxin ParD1/3/4
MGKNTSISLGSHFENFVNHEIKSGRYSSVSEVIRTALRLMENEERKLEDLRNALIKGENSDMIDDFNPNSFLDELHSGTI